MEIEVENLFSYAMKGQWRDMLEAYENNIGALEAKITIEEDTVLHIAIYVGQSSFVVTLLDSIREDECLNILTIRNSKGNTPLHLAAELGNVDICHNIARRDPYLICCRNIEGKTPLFLAAIHGKMDAFFCLHGHLQSRDDYSLCIDNKGDTILHSTISSEYFGFALKLIKLYPNLADPLNEEGLSPLHILAMKPNCFKSSTWMGLLDSFVYKCFIIDELKEDIDWTDSPVAHHYPKNYGTCMSFISCSSQAVGKDRKAATDDEENVSKQEQSKKENKRKLFPPNWETIIRFLTITVQALLIIFSAGYSSWIEKIKRKKDKHLRAKQVMNELIKHASLYKYDYTRKNPNYTKKKGTLASPILIAAKMGITEMVQKILDTFPVAIKDVDSENKNVVLLAIENRQPGVYKLLSKMDKFKETAFRQVDNGGNSALHLAATYRSHEPWRVPGVAMQMQWEYKWYKLVKSAMPPNSYEHYNKRRQTAKQVFISTHRELVKEDSKWLTKTAESCSVVAALVATVAFSTSTAIPGGPNQNTGIPILKARPAFHLFAAASLVAICSSITSLVLFLLVLTSRFHEKDFVVDLPRKLLLGMTTLLTSIASMLVSFCAGHYFILEDELKYAGYPIYVVTGLPMAFFALVQLPLYLDLTLAIFRKMPQRNYKVLPQ